MWLQTNAHFNNRFIFIVKPADTHGGRVRNNNKSWAGSLISDCLSTQSAGSPCPTCQDDATTVMEQLEKCLQILPCLLLDNNLKIFYWNSLPADKSEPSLRFWLKFLQFLYFLYFSLGGLLYSYVMMDWIKKSKIFFLESIINQVCNYSEASFWHLAKPLMEIDWNFSSHIAARTSVLTPTLAKLRHFKWLKSWTM